MSSLLFIDSAVYGGAWSTPELRALFDEVPRTGAWLEILAVLAETQAAYGLIPATDGAAVARTCRSVAVDPAFLDEVRRGFEASNHSTIGFIDAIARRCPDGSGEWTYYGATVQDLTDTWLAMALRDARAIARGRLRSIDRGLRALARVHRDTVMPGRTHGQQGLPITFGFKAAGWAAEIRRHRRRLEEIAARMDVGQLAGGVGSLSSLGPRALALQRAFLERLDLRAPQISWTTSRDVLAEWCAFATLVASSADRIGHEVYNLQRSEIGELGERSPSGTVGSITMPHKRNPEISEHLGTLARVVRHNAAIVTESLVHDHERDGRSWKCEWNAVPLVTVAADKALALLDELVSNLDVFPERMRSNLEATRGFVLSERVMLALACRIGKRSAHRLVYDATMAAHGDGRTLEEAILASREIVAHLAHDSLAVLLDYEAATGHCGTMVDRVLADAEDAGVGEARPARITGE
ncbi:MAG: adenylosuccinate lyase [Vulcanimicrobiaceae bacterium]